MKRKGIDSAALLAVGAFAACVGTASAQSAAPATTASRPAVVYVLTKLGTLGGRTSSANAINASGEVVGTADLSGGTHSAFLFRDGKMINLGALGGADSAAFGINDTGVIVGGAETGHLKGPYLYIEGWHAFFYKDRKMQDMGQPAPGKDLPAIGTSRDDGTCAHAVSNAGLIVGDSYHYSLEDRAFLYSGGKFEILGGDESGPFHSRTATSINDDGDVVGVLEASKVQENPHAFIYHQGTIQDLNTVVGSASLAAAHFNCLGYANAINVHGQIVGEACTLESSPGKLDRMHAFLYGQGHLVDLGTLGQPCSTAYGINTSGQVVGTVHNPNGNGFDRHAFLYSAGSMQDLNTVVGQDKIEAAGFKVLNVATGINDRGQIVGDGVDAKGNSIAFLLTPDSVNTSKPAKK